MVLSYFYVVNQVLVLVAFPGWCWCLAWFYLTCLVGVDAFPALPTGMKKAKAIGVVVEPFAKYLCCETGSSAPVVVPRDWWFRSHFLKELRSVPWGLGLGIGHPQEKIPP
jgi:hypothetical protein